MKGFIADGGATYLGLSKRDYEATAKFAILIVIAWTMPERFWLPLCRSLARGITRIKVGWTRATVDRLKLVTEDKLTTNPNVLLREKMTLEYISIVQRLRVLHYCGFKPHVKIIGCENLETGLEKGKGVILWAGAFFFSNLIEPMAFHKIGSPLYLLSNPGHGLANTPFAIRWLNPLIILAENQFLAERIFKTPGSASALVTLRKRLEANQVIAMRAWPAAKWVLELPLLNGAIRLAAGPVELAMITGAEVLPIFTICNEAGVCEVHIEAPIPIRNDCNKKKEIWDATAEYVSRLEPYVLSYPAQWRGWPHVHLQNRDKCNTMLQVPGIEFQN